MRAGSGFKKRAKFTEWNFAATSDERITATSAPTAPANAAQDDASTFRLFETTCFVAAVILNLGLWMFAPHEDPEVGSPIQQVLFGILYVLAIVAVVLERKAIVPLVRQSLPLALNVGFVVISVAWSEEPYTTVRRAFELVGVTALGYVFAARLGRRGFIEAFAISMVVASVISVFVIALVPSVGLMQDAYLGAWRGMFVQKNPLGGYMTLGAMTVLFLIGDSNGRRRTFWQASFALMVLLLIGSQSITAIGTAMILGAVAALLLWCRKTRSLKPIIILAGVAAALTAAARLAGIGPDDVLSLFGRDSTLTGRTDLWDFLIEAIRQKPVLGYGYQAFFVNHSTLEWGPAQAHNSFLEAALDIGIVGVLTVVIALASGVRLDWLSFWRDRSANSLWPLLVTFYLIISSTSEAMLDTSNIFWLLFVGSYLFGVQDRQKRVASDPFLETSFEQFYRADGAATSAEPRFRERPSTRVAWGKPD